MITVIIPTFNRNDYIDRAISSVLNQTFKDIEIIVVDDNNPDSEERKILEEKMKKYENNSKIKYIKHPKNMNGATARNTGINIAKGEYIAFLDDDDFYISTRLEKLYNILRQNPKYDAVYSASVIIDDKKNITSIISANKSGNISKEILLKKMTIGTGSNLFFKAEALKSINGFDTKFNRHQDLEVLVRFCQKYEVLNLDEILVVKDNSNRINSPKKVDELLKIKENYFNSFKKIIDTYNIEEQKQLYYVHYLEIIYLIMANKEFNKYKFIKQKIEQYKKINIITKLKLIRFYLYKILKIDKLKIKVNSYRNKKKIDKEILKEILDN